MRPAIVAMIMVLAAGCASTPGDPGWTGAGAEPFDGALRACEAEAAKSAGAERSTLLETCMVRRGWHRP